MFARFRHHNATNDPLDLTPNDGSQLPFFDQIQRYLLRFPVYYHGRILWNDIKDERSNWIWLIPLMLFIGYRQYRKERRAVLRLKQLMKK
ncbi:hypothetical protein HC891_18705 [Candidatus Gracilibacteria bacterium]|nr:hypothetical protein [Candidatus Gracilibacteria bacterium]